MIKLWMIIEGDGWFASNKHAWGIIKADIISGASYTPNACNEKHALPYFNAMQIPSI